jgi:chromosome segregation protein
MVYIKKLVMHGFKSFVRKTEIPFTQGINIILGPNGSGKSNISDALCFVLGRLSAKSMRAARAGNLIFLGTKEVPPMKEASVEIIFDNSDKIFSLESDEISIKRTLRKNGQSSYKINNETKTRQDILTLLAQAGIDPNGFNIILQGEIQNFVRMQSEERRKVIEEVSGISVYESRKEKSLRELDKTEEKLKEIAAILRERTAYLNNLEKERQEALRYQKLEKDAKKYRASIIYHDLTKKKKNDSLINENISKKEKEIASVKKEILNFEEKIRDLESKIEIINRTIKQSTGVEQEKLNREIADIRAELAGMNVKIENYENKLSEISRQKNELNEKIIDYELLIKELQKESPTIIKKEKALLEKKNELAKLEKEIKKFYTIRSELKSLKERIDDKKSIIQNYSNESEFLLKQINMLSIELFDIKSDEEKLNRLKKSLVEKKDLLVNLNRTERELEKKTYLNESEIAGQKKLSDRISSIDICPFCKSKITPGHIREITSEISLKIKKLSEDTEKSDAELNRINEKKKILEQEIDGINSEISKRESDVVRLLSINEKKEQLKLLQSKTDNVIKEISLFEKRKKTLEKDFDENSNIEQKYENLKIELQEISLRSEENVSSEISFKKMELERTKVTLKQALRDEENLREELAELNNLTDEKENLLNEKRSQEEELTNKFRKMISERDSFQNKIRDNEIALSGKRNVIYTIEQDINNFKIDKARVGAEIENLEIEMLGFGNIEVIKANRENLIERLNHTQEILSRIGSVNLRSLEVYDSVKKDYEIVKGKAEIIEKEKDGILKIIHEIDIKKKKTFMKTLDKINEIFSRNFSQLSTKGVVSLELENKKEPFEGGVGIIVKTGHGKYFDARSLSGGEQTIIALSLIFAIQELNPYYFYILDEIDAALDKRNSERLAGLLRKYMQRGQYIVITHNDEIITNATSLYGVSMHDGISKIISLKI